MSLLRQPLLLLARSAQVKKLVSTMPVSSGIVRSYVPGETTVAAVGATSVLEAISNVLPLSYAVDAMSTLTTTTATADVWRDLAVVTAYALGALALGAATLRRRTP